MKRLTSFSLIGGGVMFAGLSFQIALVRYCGLGPNSSYAAQAFFSIELSYLLNRYLTWRNQESGFWTALWKFNVQKLLMTVVNMAAYALLVRFGMQYIVANVLLTAILTPINYFASDLLVFVRSYHGKRRKGSHPDGLRDAPEFPAATPVRPPAVLPSVSVIIPCKSSEKTIRATVAALLDQDYPALKEVILVGDVNDSTFTAVRDIRDPRLILLEQEKTPGRRDPNVKRDRGIRESTGEVLALADSDIVMDPDWLSRAVSLLVEQGGGLVAGGMRSIHNTFWGRFVDSNMLAAKTPRLRHPYRVTAENFGKRGFKPPVTANAVFTRDLYEACPLDVTWAFGYEDYEWFWRLARQGHSILFSGDLTAAHHHRRSFKHLVREYRQAAYGCAQFIRAHPDSPLAKKRTQQAFGLPALAAVALVAAGAAVISGFAVELAAVLCVAALVVTVREAVQARSIEGLTYVPAAFALGGIFTWILAGNLMHRSPQDRVAPTWAPSIGSIKDTSPDVLAGERIPAGIESSISALTGKDDRSPHKGVCWPLLAILAVQAGLSLGLVWSNTAFSDEALYLWAGHLEIANWLHGNSLPTGNESFQSYFSGAPQIYPVLGAIADGIGGLAAARLMSLAFMLLANVFLYLITSRIFDRRTALYASALWGVCEPTIRLSFATYDSLAVLLMCAGTWLGIRASYARRRGEMVAATALTLSLGSATAYSYAIYIPSSIAVIIMASVPQNGWKRAMISGAWLAAGTIFGVVFIPTALKLWPGILSTTVTRNGGTSGYLSVARSAWEWGAFIMCTAVAACIVGVSRRRPEKMLLGVLAASAFLVPINQFRIQMGISLDKHMALGLWFAAVASGWGLARIMKLPRSRVVAFSGCALLLAIPGVAGWQSAFSTFHLWPDASRAVTAFDGIQATTRGKVLVAEYGDSPIPVLRYYSHDRYRWRDWNGMWLNRSTSEASYAGQIVSGGYKIVAIPFGLGFSDPTAGQVILQDLSELIKQHGDQAVLQELVRIATYGSSGKRDLYAFTTAVENDPNLKVAAVAPYNSHVTEGIYVIWKWVPQSQVTNADNRHVRVKGKK